MVWPWGLLVLKRVDNFTTFKVLESNHLGNSKKWLQLEMVIYEKYDLEINVLRAAAYKGFYQKAWHLLFIPHSSEIILIGTFSY